MTKLLPFLAVLALLVATPAKSLEVDESPRRTATVKLIEKCLPSVVGIRTLVPHDKPNLAVHKPGGEVALDVGMEGPGSAKQPIAPALYFRREQPAEGK